MPLIRCLFLPVLLALHALAAAAPVYYQLTLTVSQGFVVHSHFDGQDYVHDPVDAAGNVYHGYFGIDDSILAADGVGKAGDLQFFYIGIEDNVWAYNAPGNNSFAGFRGADFQPGAVSPGFDVVGGEITGLRGGVHGGSDVPFVDFSIDGTPGSFRALGLSFASPTRDARTLQWTPFGGSAPGTLVVSRVASVPFAVPEPAGLGLVVFALLALALQRARAASRRPVPQPAAMRSSVWCRRYPAR